MAEDAREVAETSREAVTTLPKKPYTPPAPPTGANEYARPAQATLTDAVKSISMEDFKNVHMQPCVRNSLLYGIGTGFAFGGLRLVLGGTAIRAIGVNYSCNWLTKVAEQLPYQERRTGRLVHLRVLRS